VVVVAARNVRPFVNRSRETSKDFGGPRALNSFFPAPADRSRRRHHRVMVVLYIIIIIIIII
jgi:hypothetical protein